MASASQCDECLIGNRLHDVELFDGHDLKRIHLDRNVFHKINKNGKPIYWKTFFSASSRRRARKLPWRTFWSLSFSRKKTLEI
jgi:hypothetical protein